MIEASYVNNKNEKITLTISSHAKTRFMHRWPAVFPTKKLLLDIDSEIISIFNKAVRVQKFSRKEKTRLRRYGNDTLFFRNNKFTFVVKNATIITIELSSRDLRKFNRADSGEITRRAEEINFRRAEEIKLQDNPGPTIFRLIVYYFDDERNIRISNLGSYPLTPENDVSQLKKDSAFVVFIKNKLVEKFPQNTEFSTVYCSVGGGKEKKCVFDQLELQHLLTLDCP